MVDKVNGEEDDRSITATVIKDIRSLKYDFNQCCISFTRRENNCISHKLAKFAMNLANVTEWKHTFPVWLLEITQADLVRQWPQCL